MAINEKYCGKEGNHPGHKHYGPSNKKGSSMQVLYYCDGKDPALKGKKEK